MNKYKNKKTFIDHILFDSKKEAERYLILKKEENDGLIKDLSLQPIFELIKAGINDQGLKYRKTAYIADFKYFDVKAECWVVEDAKGFKTEAYKLKRKIFLSKYPDIYFQEI